MAKQKIKITNEFIDQDSNMQIRGSKSDFETIEYRHINVVQNMPGFMNNSGLIDIIGKAMSHYNSGWYSQALNYLLKALDITPNLSPYLFYYKKICERVIDIDMTEDEEIYERKRMKYRSRLESLPKFLWKLLPKIKNRMRCKWCGRYTSFVDPDTPTFGFADYNNSCDFCRSMYPMPSWLWDSPDGRAYSYYRMSFPKGEQFYIDFFNDYNPDPLNNL